jgi:hypothetical protein
VRHIHRTLFSRLPAPDLQGVESAPVEPFGLPLHALRCYFPALWPEAEADVPGTPP